MESSSGTECYHDPSGALGRGGRRNVAQEIVEKLKSLGYGNEKNDNGCNGNEVVKTRDLEFWNDFSNPRIEAFLHWIVEGNDELNSIAKVEEENRKLCNHDGVKKFTHKAMDDLVTTLQKRKRILEKQVEFSKGKVQEKEMLLEKHNQALHESTKEAQMESNGLNVAVNAMDKAIGNLGDSLNEQSNIFFHQIVKKLNLIHNNNNEEEEEEEKEEDEVQKITKQATRLIQQSISDMDQMKVQVVDPEIDSLVEMIYKARVSNNVQRIEQASLKAQKEFLSGQNNNIECAQNETEIVGLENCINEMKIEMRNLVQSYPSQVCTSESNETSTGKDEQSGMSLSTLNIAKALLNLQETNHLMFQDIDQKLEQESKQLPIVEQMISEFKKEVCVPEILEEIEKLKVVMVKTDDNEKQKSSLEDAPSIIPNHLLEKQADLQKTTADLLERDFLANEKFEVLENALENLNNDCEMVRDKVFNLNIHFNRVTSA